MIPIRYSCDGFRVTSSLDQVPLLPRKCSMSGLCGEVPCFRFLFRRVYIYIALKMPSLQTALPPELANNAIRVRYDTFLFNSMIVCFEI